MCLLTDVNTKKHWCCSIPTIKCTDTNMTHLKPVNGWYDKSHEHQGAEVSKGAWHEPLPQAYGVAPHRCSWRRQRRRRRRNIFMLSLQVRRLSKGTKENEKKKQGMKRNWERWKGSRNKKVGTKKQERKGNREQKHRKQKWQGREKGRREIGR